MKKLNSKQILQFLGFLFGILYCVCNVIDIRVMSLSFFGTTINFGCGIFAFPLLFLITDIVGEIWGKEASDSIVRYGLLAQLVFLGFSQLALFLPATSVCAAGAYESVFGTSLRFIVASIAAYWVSQKWDVWIFHKVRNWYVVKKGSTDGGRWIWNNASTMSSQVLNSVVYCFAAYGFNALGGSIFFWGILLTWVIAWLDTPVFYLATNKLRKIVSEENYNEEEC